MRWPRVNTASTFRPNLPGSTRSRECSLLAASLRSYDLIASQLVGGTPRLRISYSSVLVSGLPIACCSLTIRQNSADPAGITVASTEGLAPANKGLYRRIGLRIAVNGDYDNLLALLAAIDKATPPLVVDNLQIRARLQALAMLQAANAPRPPAAAAATRLDAGFEVYGFRRQEAPLASRQ